MECQVFGSFVVVLTAVWVYGLRDRSFAFLAYAMFFPGIVAFSCSAMNGDLKLFAYKVLGFSQVRVYVIIIVHVLPYAICQLGSEFSLNNH